MRKWQVFVSVFSFIVVVGEAKAGDEEEVMAKLNSWYTVLTAGDIDALEMSPHTRFNLNGGLLSDANFKGQIKAWVATSGVKINIQGHHGDVKVYGDAAVYTGYESVNITSSKGEERQETNRVTVVWAKQKDDWRAVHVHVSSLTPVNPK